MSATRIITGLRALRRPPPRPVVTIGIFDGVHRAHQQLLRTTVRLARRLHGTSIAITFDPDPRTVLHPSQAPQVLMPLHERVAHLQRLGIEAVWMIRFTRAFSRTTAEQFVRRMLIDRLHTAAVVVGETFVFGRDTRGTMETLRRLGSRHGLRVVPVQEITDHGNPISSSRIRRLIARGQLRAAGRLLGRAPSLYGTVVRGAGRGRQLGFPTANVRLVSTAIPPSGVYAVSLQCAGSRAVRHGVMNLGVRPTFGPGPLVCEVHLPGFSGTLLGRQVAVSLRARIRSERRFTSSAALRRQVCRDLAQARRILAA